eukprot:1382478-Amorphochlora_amoeboformis.AAC.1
MGSNVSDLLAYTPCGLCCSPKTVSKYFCLLVLLSLHFFNLRLMIGKNSAILGPSEPERASILPRELLCTGDIQVSSVDMIKFRRDISVVIGVMLNRCWTEFFFQKTFKYVDEKVSMHILLSTFRHTSRDIKHTCQSQNAHTLP